jgi:predicted nucleic acid-binding protein
LLQRKATGARVEERVLADGQHIHAPHVIDLEVTQALWRFVRAGTVAATQAAAALDAWRSLAVTRHAHDSLLSRIWVLRENITVYDAAYVALAELLDAPLITCDEKLASATQHLATIELVARGA